MIILDKLHLKKIEEIVFSYSGILFSRIATKQLEAKIVDQMKKSGFTNVARYIDALEGCNLRASEMDDLISELTVSESSFFRNPGQFEYLLGNIFPTLYKKSKGKHFPIRIFSAGCACGEETYSIAFMVKQFKMQYPEMNVEILAGDINSKNLAIAKNGEYVKNGKLKRVDDFEKKYGLEMFKCSEDRKCKILPEFKEYIQFLKLNLRNLGKLDYLSGSDVIFCRNVMIYFDDELKTNLIKEFYKRLNPGGILFVGESECLPADQDYFSLVECGHDSYGYRKNPLKGAV